MGMIMVMSDDALINVLMLLYAVLTWESASYFSIKPVPGRYINIKILLKVEHLASGQVIWHFLLWDTNTQNYQFPVCVRSSEKAPEDTNVEVAIKAVTDEAGSYKKYCNRRTA